MELPPSSFVSLHLADMLLVRVNLDDLPIAQRNTVPAKFRIVLERVCQLQFGCIGWHVDPHTRVDSFDQIIAVLDLEMASNKSIRYGGPEGIMPANSVKR